MAARFIVHVEVLFGAIDRLNGLHIKATGQGNPSEKPIDGRTVISEGGKAPLSEDCQFLLLVE
jgi:hypothetical protein